MTYEPQKAHNAPSVTDETHIQSGIAREAVAPLPFQRKENNTGMPDNLKAGIEDLSGIAMDDVKVHYNSSQPAQLQAHAYAQGTDIHIAPGQERHLPHEAWHVVQQKQGRVVPTVQLKAEVGINDDAGLEQEADVMGDKAVQMKGIEDEALQMKEIGEEEKLVQMKEIGEEEKLM